MKEWCWVCGGHLILRARDSGMPFQRSSCSGVFRCGYTACIHFYEWVFMPGLVGRGVEGTSGEEDELEREIEKKLKKRIFENF